MKKYDKKITVSLTTEDFDRLNTLAEDDRRTPNQMASIFLEDAIGARTASPSATVTKMAQAV